MNIITTQVPSATHRKTRAADQILNYAASIGLPAPTQVSICTSAEIAFGVNSLADLADWALWMEVPVLVNVVASMSASVHKARGTALEQPIEVWFTTFTAEVQ